MVSQTKSNPSGFFINSLIHVPYVVEDLTHRRNRRNKTQPPFRFRLSFDPSALVESRVNQSTSGRARLFLLF